MIIVFDTETTGLTLHPDAPIEKQPRIIEFGAVLLDRRGVVVDTTDLLIDPGIELPEEITRITGITSAQLKGAGPFESHLPVIAEFFSRAETVVAHNLPFDRTMMRNELTLCDALQAFPWPAREVCTVGLYKELWGRNPKLKELYARIMNKEVNQTHRAVDDAMLIVEIIRAEELWRIL